MKTYKLKTILFGIFVSTITLSFIACKAKELSIKDLAKIENITNKVESKRYEFVPTSANPMGYRQVNLDNSYFLRMANDTLSVYLPYFGRSYTAPIDPNQIGYNFTSTDFEYSIEAKKDRWEVQIKLADTKYRGLQLYLSIGNTGYADLRIQDTSRQSISYYGRISED